MKFDFCPKLLLVIVFCGLVACDQQAEQRTVDLTVPVTVQSVETGTIESIVTATGNPKTRARSPDHHGDSGKSVLEQREQQPLARQGVRG